jgi:hypothetical protein
LRHLCAVTFHAGAAVGSVATALLLLAAWRVAEARQTSAQASSIVKAPEQELASAVPAASSHTSLAAMQQDAAGSAAVAAAAAAVVATGPGVSCTPSGGGPPPPTTTTTTRRDKAAAKQSPCPSPRAAAAAAELDWGGGVALATSSSRGDLVPRRVRAGALTRQSSGILSDYSSANKRRDAKEEGHMSAAPLQAHRDFATLNEEPPPSPMQNARSISPPPPSTAGAHVTCIGSQWLPMPAGRPAVVAAYPPCPTATHSQPPLQLPQRQASESPHGAPSPGGGWERSWPVVWTPRSDRAREPEACALTTARSPSPPRHTPTPTRPRRDDSRSDMPALPISLQQARARLQAAAASPNRFLLPHSSSPTAQQGLGLLPSDPSASFKTVLEGTPKVVARSVSPQVLATAMQPTTAADQQEMCAMRRNPSCPDQLR